MNDYEIMNAHLIMFISHGIVKRQLHSSYLNEVWYELSGYYNVRDVCQLSKFLHTLPVLVFRES